MTRDEAEKKIGQSAKNLLGAAKSEILKMIRKGATPTEVLEALQNFRLPVREAARLRDELTLEMESLTRAQESIARDAGEGSRVTASAEAARAAYQVTSPQIKSSIKNYLVKETRRAIASGSGPSGLKRNLAARSGAAESELETLANTMVAQYNNNLTFSQAETAQVERFIYSGPLAPSTRPFCRAHVGIIFTKDQIALMDNGQGVSVESTCGGYRCRHSWEMVPPGISDTDAGGRALGKNNRVLKVGKVSMLVDKKSEADVFDHHKLIYVESEKFNRTSEWLSVAKPLARTHDGLTETVTGSPSDGVWTKRHHTDRTTGEILSNFEFHAKTNAPDYSSRDSYRSAMHEMIRDPETIVYRDGEGFILRRSGSSDVMTTNFKGAIESFSKMGKREFEEFIKGKRRLDTLSTYLYGGK